MPASPPPPDNGRPRSDAAGRSARHFVGAALLTALHLAERVLAGVFAVLIVFLEWGWQPLADLLARLGRLRPFARLEIAIRRLPPYGALAVFALPSVMLLPLKLLALFLIAQGYKLGAAALFLGAKIVGTAVVARLYILTETKLMQIGWFRAAYDRFIPIKHRLVDWVRGSAVWRYGRVARRAASIVVRPFMRAVRANATAWLAVVRGWIASRKPPPQS